MLERLRHLLFGYEPPVEHRIWHEHPAGIVRCIDGSMANSEYEPVWRRWHDGRWEYRCHERESVEDWAERQW